ncbi:hypothetical protein F5I97DRAFT_1255370 [Phlebopus sp. FC_14]|nr:hypothetical protein F5I97DRAFT_1255370 [Phlebopus sp. FC_14]
MVRQAKQTPEEKKELRKKKTPQHDKPPKKKVVESGVWPCKMDGCNKQFAREADLKRHQRTTKLHSVPGFACPQCDATFTRTDALRRHQKSRHNGVVIEPAEDKKKSAANDESSSSGSRSKSRSNSPSLKEEQDVPSGPSTSQPPNSLPPGGPQSYYRHHTLPGMLMSPPPGMIIEGQYPPGMVLPTPSTRLHQASWPPPPPWDGSHPPPHMIPIGYPHPYYASYYRPGMMHPHSDLVSPHIQDGVGSPHTGESSSSRTGSPAMPEGDTSAAVIDPSLVSPPSSSVDGRSVSMRVTQAAVEGVFESADRESSAAEASVHTSAASDTARSSPGRGQGSSYSSSEQSREGEEGDETTGQNPQTYSSPHSNSLERPPEMEQMLTEDGEPMLNPAELLTQESLASPPPS